MAWGGGGYVRWSDPFRAILNIESGALVFFVVGLIILTYAGSDLVSGRRVLDQEVLAQGRVERVWQRPAAQPCTAGCTIYGVDYSYAAGHLIQGSARIEQKRWLALYPGAPMDVWYLRGTPEAHELGHGTQYWNALLGVGLSLAVTVLGAGLFMLRMVRFGRAIMLRETGQRRTAKITHLRSGYNRSPWFAFWRDETGATGRIARVWRSNLPPVGATITIYADPTGKLPAVWTGDCGVR